MTPIDVDYMLKHWELNIEKGFKYLFYSLYGPEYLVIARRSKEQFETLQDRSSIKYTDLDENGMRRHLMSGAFILINDNAWQISYKYFKSQGCQCGAWSTRDPERHSPICPKYKV